MDQEEAPECGQDKVRTGQGYEAAGGGGTGKVT